MKTIINRLKLLALTLIALPLLAAVVLTPASARTGSATEEFDAAAAFKAKCAMCHGQKAEKRFDATLADDALVEIVLKGKDATPIKMPAYEAKGISSDQAKTLVAHMKSLKQ